MELWKWKTSNQRTQEFIPVRSSLTWTTLKPVALSLLWVCTLCLFACVHVCVCGEIVYIQHGLLSDTSAPPDPPKDLSLYDLEDDSLTLSWIPGQSHNSPILGAQNKITNLLYVP